MFTRSVLTDPLEILRRADAAEEAAVAATGAVPADATCRICYGDGEDAGLVRGCACRGSAAYAHIECLAQEASVRARNTLGQHNSR